MVIGLTGHSGSGKTTVAGIMADLGFCHIDCDKIVHTRVYTDPAVHRLLCEEFGDSIVQDGNVNRRALAAIIFSDRSRYVRLMELVKPFIDAAVTDSIAACGDNNVLVDAPALFEYGMQGICDVTVGVISDSAVERIVVRDGISADDARRRLAHQQSHSFYVQNCDHIIKNNGSLDELTRATADVCKRILADAVI